MYPRSQPDHGQNPTTGSDNIRARLSSVLDRITGIHGTMDGILEGVWGPRLQEASPTPPSGQTYPNTLDQIDYRLTCIERNLEFLSARL